LPEQYQSPEGAFLKDLFRHLNNGRVQYCVLRNYDSLPYCLEGSDLDILVAAEFIQIFYRVLWKVVKSYRGKAIICYGDFTPRLCLCGKDEKWWGVQLDIHEGVLPYKIYSYMNAEIVLGRAEVNKGVYIANKSDAAMIGFLKEVLNNLKCRDENIKEASNAYIFNRQHYEGEFTTSFGKNISNLLGEYFDNQGKNIDLRTIGKKGRAALQTKAVNSYGSLIIWKRFWITWKKYKRLLWPIGFSVAVLGCDGSGKSTIIKGIFRPLSDAVHGAIKCEHMRPNILPSLATLFGRHESEGPVTDPHGSKPSGFAGSLLRVIYYSLDYVFGYWLKVFPLMVKRPTIWVFDRYFYDYLIDPHRSRIILPHWVIRLFGLLIPKPDIILCLGADPEVIHARKSELSMEEVERQVAEIRIFCKKNPRAVWIDTGCSVEESVGQSLEAITSHMAARYKKPKRDVMKDRYPKESEYLWQSDQSCGYVALPSKRNCRWIMPLNSVLAERGWNIYLPFSYGGRVFKNILHYLSKNEFLKLFRSQQINLRSSPMADQLRRQIEAVFHRDNTALAISTGTPGPFRKITACIISEDGKILGYAKIGNSALAIRRIKHEATVLKKLGFDKEIAESGGLETNIKIFMPECLYDGEVGKSYVLIQSPPQFEGKMGDRFFNQKYGEIIRTLTGLGFVRLKLGESRFLKSLKSEIEDYSVLFRESLREGLRHLEKGLGEEEMIFCLSHGDFAPWNMLWQKNHVFLFDWESAVLEAPAGLDLMHFLFQTGFLLKKKRDTRLLCFILDGGKKYHGELSSTFGNALPDVKNLLLLYLLHMAVTEDKPNQFSPAAVARRNIINLVIADGM